MVLVERSPASDGASRAGIAEGNCRLQVVRRLIMPLVGIVGGGLHIGFEAGDGAAYCNQDPRDTKLWTGDVQA